MALFLILAPFGAFGMLMLVASTAVSLFAAAALSLGIIGYDMLHGRSVKMLAAGSVLLFSMIGGYTTLIDGSFSAVAVRLAVDGGVLAIALLSLAIRLPFTLQYARERVDPEIVKLPHFVRVNYILTWAWTGAFVLMLVADTLAVYVPGLPLWIGMAIAFAARNSAVYFTKWYPQYRRMKNSMPTTSRS
ncbi:MAG: hypothetical protein JWQ94_1491 [Tardiphaga sp.]|nr:hypothetical protein [Tardiphaga sp.]